MMIAGGGGDRPHCHLWIHPWPNVHESNAYEWFSDKVCSFYAPFSGCLQGYYPQFLSCWDFVSIKS